MGDLNLNGKAVSSKANMALAPAEKMKKRISNTDTASNSDNVQCGNHATEADGNFVECPSANSESIVISPVPNSTASVTSPAPSGNTVASPLCSAPPPPPPPPAARLTTGDISRFDSSQVVWMNKVLT